MLFFKNQTKRRVAPKAKLGTYKLNSQSSHFKQFNSHHKQEKPHVQFYLMRHGQTEWNRSIFEEYGPSDLHLTQNGIRQVIDFSKCLKEKRIDKIITSPTIRTIQTAFIVSRELNNVPINSEDLLKPRYFGNWQEFKTNLASEGLSLKQILDEANIPENDPTFFKHIKSRIEKNLPTTAENLDSYTKRINNAYMKHFFGEAKILPKFWTPQCKNALFISHGSSFRVLSNLLDINFPKLSSEYGYIMEITASRSRHISSVEYSAQDEYSKFKQNENNKVQRYQDLFKQFKNHEIAPKESKKNDPILDGLEDLNDLIQKIQPKNKDQKHDYSIEVNVIDTDTNNDNGSFTFS